MNMRLAFALSCALLAGCLPAPPPPPAAEVPAPPKSPYIGRWHSRWTETVENIGSVEHDEYLTLAEDGTASREYVTSYGGRNPQDREMKFRWSDSNGQLEAFCTDDGFVNENGDKPDVVAILRPDGRLVATLLWWQEPTVVYEPVPMLPK